MNKIIGGPELTTPFLTLIYLSSTSTPFEISFIPAHSIIFVRD